MPEDRLTFPETGPPNDPKIEVLKNGRTISVIRKVDALFQFHRRRTVSSFPRTAIAYSLTSTAQRMDPEDAVANAFSVPDDWTWTCSRAPCPC